MPPAKTRYNHTAVRLPHDLSNAVDDLCKRQSKTLGRKVTRAEIIVAALRKHVGVKPADVLKEPA